MAVLLALIPIGYSYVTTMLQPSNASFGVRTAEWVRDHGGAWLVSGAERLYYSLTAPDKGGPQLRSLPSVGTSVSLPETARPRTRLPYRPHNLRPVIRPALPQEGVWHATRRNAGPAPPVLVTTYRSDPSYPRMVAGVAWIDTSRTRLALYPGRYQPPSGGVRGPMEVPPALRSSLVATFNSGFKLQDARGGFVAGGHSYAPLTPGIATLVERRHGQLDVRAWQGAGQPPGDVVAARQNLPLIVDHGVRNPNLSDGPEWGATLGNAVRVWRSGVGIDRRGNLIYAAANDQTVRSLADLLIHAGAVRAMELDINSAWVSFITYGGSGARAPVKLLPDMNPSATRYLSPDDRDFFAVYARGGR